MRDDYGDRVRDTPVSETAVVGLGVGGTRGLLGPRRAHRTHRRRADTGPYAPNLEHTWLPDTARIADAIRDVVAA